MLIATEDGPKRDQVRERLSSNPRLGVMASTDRHAWHPPRRFLLPFVIAHSCLSVGLSLLAFINGMDRFDSGLPPTFLEKVVETLSDVLRSPLFKLAMKSRLLGELFSGLLGYIPFVANSVLWAFLVWWLLAFLARSFAARPRPLP
jgi:hypothetical protein